MQAFHECLFYCYPNMAKPLHNTPVHYALSIQCNYAFVSSKNVASERHWEVYEYLRLQRESYIHSRLIILIITQGFENITITFWRSIATITQNMNLLQSFESSVPVRTIFILQQCWNQHVYTLSIVYSPPMFGLSPIDTCISVWEGSYCWPIKTTLVWIWHTSVRSHTHSTHTASTGAVARSRGTLCWQGVWLLDLSQWIPLCCVCVCVCVGGG